MFKSKLTFFRWYVFAVIWWLALWMICGNLLASHLEKEIEREIAQKLKELEEEYPDLEPNDSALKLEAILSKEFGIGGIREAYRLGAFKLGDYIKYHPDFNKSKESKDEFEKIKESLDEYIDTQLLKPNDEIEPAPQELQSYLESKVDALNKLKNHVFNSELPKPKTAIEQVIYLLEGGYPVSRSLIYFYSNSFQEILALDILEKQRQGKNQEAREMLEVSWRISQFIKNDITLASQLFALTIEAFHSEVVLRKVDNLSPYWQERCLLEQDYYLSILRLYNLIRISRKGSPTLSLLFENLYFWRALMEKQNIEEQILTRDTCSPQKEGLLSELMYGMLKLEFTQKILQVKELAKQQGKWPDSIPNLDSKFCPDRQYIYKVSEDGTMTISLNKQPEWVKDRDLPLTYSDRTPPKQKIVVGWVEERNPTNQTFNSTDQKLSWVALPLNPTYDEMKTYIEQLENNPNWEIRSQVAKALGKLNQNPDTVIPVLIAALEDTDEVVRLRAAFSLIKIGLPAVPQLIDALETENPSALASAKFALRSMGMSIAPTLSNALSSSDRQVRSSAASIFGEMAAHIEDRPISQAASLSELKQAVSYLEEALRGMEGFIKLGRSQVFPNDALLESVGGYEREDVEAIRTSLVFFKSEIRSHYARNFLQGFFLTLSCLILAIVLLFWYRPDLFIRWSKSRLQAKQNREETDKLKVEVQKFLQKAGATSRDNGKHGLQITSAAGKLKSYIPIPVSFAIEQPDDQDIVELVQQGNKMKKSNQQQAGIIFYREPPDTLFRVEMTKVRLSYRFILIPIPLTKEIHIRSGGHPFVSRQLASLLCKKLAAEHDRNIQFANAQRYLSKPFTYSGVLKDYCGQNIWSDIEKRGFQSAMNIMRLLAANEKLESEISSSAILKKLQNQFTESECLDALLWLESVGLILQQELGIEDVYQIKLPLLSQWLRMQMKQQEMQEWQLS